MSSSIITRTHFQNLVNNRPIKVTTIPFQNDKGEWSGAEVNVDITERKKVEDELQKHLDRLDELAEEHTEELKAVNKQIVQELSELKKAEEQARNAYLDLDQIFNVSSDGMRVIDKDFNMLLYNKNFSTLTDLSEDELTGKKCYEVFHGPLCHTPNCTLARILNGEEYIEDDMEEEKNDGTKIPCIVTAIPFRSGDGTLIGMVVNYKDITERKEMEEELKRSNVELEQFAYVVSHDLQEPLRTIAGYLNLLARRYTGKLDSKANSFIKRTIDGAARMQRIINDLLNYSRIGAPFKFLKPANCEVVLKDALKNLKVMIGETCAKVSHDFLPTLLAESTQLTQLFQNLIANAIKFHSDKPPEVHIAARHQDGEWLFSVRDNGIGIDSKDADRIFLIFQKLQSWDEYPGTGIGLAICKRIVELHGGRIWLKSQARKGSTFYFTIPDREGVSS